MLVGVDVGGTFTDLVALADGRLAFAKVPSTPADITEGIVAALRRLSPTAAGIRLLFHGTTVAINTILERSGARTALLTTEGFRDVYEIGRGTRPYAFDMLFPRPQPLVPRRLRLEVRERMDSRGRVLTPLDARSLDAALDVCARAGVEAVAICFLHGHVNPAHERQAVEAVAARLPGVAVSAAHELVREYREYERTSTTVLDAYVKPQVGRYLNTLRHALAELRFAGQLLLTQSAGGAMSPDVARALPLALLESGPAAGAIGAAYLARELGLSRIVAFDMGGTTAKAALIEDYTPRTARPYYVGGVETGLPSLLPVLDLVEIGAGGGSVAYRDEAGALKVGPRSAGAEPGPACYGRGGAEPTVTDADLVLGRLSPTGFLGGELRLDTRRAEATLAERVARPLGLSVEQAAAGIVAIVDNSMALAVRQVSVERGRDPRELVLVAFGGAGPTHALAIARQLGIPRVLVPRMPGHFSAFGMLASDLRHEITQSLVVELGEVEPERLAAGFAALEAQARGLLRSEGARDAAVALERLAELRYRHQEFTLPVQVDFPLADPVQVRAALRQRFGQAHSQAYGFAVGDEPIQVVNLKVVAIGRVAKPPLLALAPGGETGEARPAPRRPVYFRAAGGFVDCAIYRRADLPPGARVAGPAVIEEAASTTVLHPGDRAEVGAYGELLVHTPAEGHRGD